MRAIMLSSYKYTAVVLSMYDTGVATARCLGRLGIAVEGYDYDSSMPGFRSRYCNARLCPNPTTDPAGLLRFLLCNSDKNTFKILYPASDEYVLFASRYRDDLETAYKCVLPDKSLIESIVNKSRQYEVIRNLGIYTPDTYFIDSVEDLRQAKDAFRYPVFIKPVYGYEWKKVFDCKGFLVRNEAELWVVYEKIYLNKLKVIIQDVIPGPCTNNYEVSVYAGIAGEIFGEITIQKMRQYPGDFGFGTLIVTARNREVEQLSHSIIRKLDWKGFANIEFKYDLRDQKYKYIEINARVWQQISLAERLGMNFPLLQYLDLTGNKPGVCINNRENVKWMDPKFDFVASFQMLLRGELSLSAWIKSFKGVKDSGLFARDDVKPFLHSIRYGAFIFKLPKFLTKKFVFQKMGKSE